jgi:hypothetical protein
VQWEQTTLPTRTEPGYGERALPAEDLVKFDSRPTLVWFFDLEDEDLNRKCESTVFSNEKLGLALKRFRCVKIDVQSIAEDRLRREYASQTPAFRIIDPAGETLAVMQGPRATSLSRFRGMVSSAWRKMFTMSQDNFVRKMTDILNRLDRVNSQKTVLDSQKKRYQERGNRRKLAEVERDAEELAAEQKKIEQDEEAIKEACSLRDSYLKKDDEVADSR